MRRCVGWPQSRCRQAGAEAGTAWVYSKGPENELFGKEFFLLQDIERRSSAGGCNLGHLFARMVKPWDGGNPGTLEKQPSR